MGHPYADRQRDITSDQMDKSRRVYTPQSSDYPLYRKKHVHAPPLKEEPPSVRKDNCHVNLFGSKGSLVISSMLRISSESGPFPAFYDDRKVHYGILYCTSLHKLFSLQLAHLFARHTFFVRIPNHKLCFLYFSSSFVGFLISADGLLLKRFHTFLQHRIKFFTHARRTGSHSLLFTSSGRQGKYCSRHTSSIHAAIRLLSVRVSKVKKKPSPTC